MWLWSVETTGKTVEEAIEEALRQLGVTRDQVDVEIIEAGASGIFGVGAIPARVRVTLKNSPATLVKEFLSTLIRHGGWNLKVEDPQEREGELYINIEGEDAGLIIGKGGATLNALQLLVQTAITRRVQRPIRVIVDASRYREKRRSDLINLALKAADRARTEKRPIRLRNLSPAERRIIHMTLQPDPTVFTVSEGEEPNRVVLVAPVEMRGRILRRLRQRQASQQQPPQGGQERPSSPPPPSP